MSREIIPHHILTTSIIFSIYVDTYALKEREYDGWNTSENNMPDAIAFSASWCHGYQSCLKP